MKIEIYGGRAERGPNFQTVEQTPINAQKKAVVVQGDYRIDPGRDTYVFADSTPQAFNVVLPDADLWPEFEYVVKRIGTNSVTIRSVKGQLIDGSTTLVIGTQYISYTLKAKNGAWWIV